MTSLTQFLKLCKTLNVHQAVGKKLSNMNSSSGAYKERVRAAELVLQLLSGGDTAILINCIIKKKAMKA